MASMNKVFLVGNLTRNPELRYTPGGAAVCEFGMAMNRTYTSNNEKKEEVCFVDITVWGKQAEACDKYLQKGSPLLVEGRLHLDQWQDKETQKQRSRLKVVAERTQFIGAPRGGGDFQGENGNDSYSGNSNYGGQQQQPPAAQAPSAQPYNAYGTSGNNTGGFNQPPPAAPAPAAVPTAQPQSFAPPPPAPTVAPTAAPVTAPAAPMPAAPTAQPKPTGDAFNPSNGGSEDDIPF